MTDLLQKTLTAIRDERARALELGFELIGVVGSVARGEAGPESDVDVAYDVVGRASLFGLARIVNTLEDALDRDVDVVDLSQVRPFMREELERDLVRA